MSVIMCFQNPDFNQHVECMRTAWKDTRLCPEAPTRNCFGTMATSFVHFPEKWNCICLYEKFSNHKMTACSWLNIGRKVHIVFTFKIFHSKSSLRWHLYETFLSQNKKRFHVKAQSHSHTALFRLCPCSAVITSECHSWWERLHFLLSKN